VEVRGDTVRVLRAGPVTEEEIWRVGDKG
jgi:hypothetical protein